MKSKRFVPMFALLATFAVFGSTSAAPSFAQAQPNLAPAPFAAGVPGTQMRWRNMKTGEEDTGVIGEPDGLMNRWTWKGKDQTGYWFCMYCTITRTDLDDYAEIWPLEVGKSVSFWRYKDRSKWKNTIEVVGTERLNTPFGAIDTYVVKSKSQAYSHGWNGEQTNWYAPEIGWLVKFTFSDNEGTSEAWEAVKFTPPQ